MANKWTFRTLWGGGTQIEIRSESNIRDYGYFETCQDGRIIISDKSFINRNAMIVSAGEIYIGTHCALGPNVIMYDHDHVVHRNAFQNWNDSSVGKITIFNDCWIAANSLILKDTVVNHNAVVGAGSVVKGIVPANSIFIQKKENKYKDILL